RSRFLPHPVGETNDGEPWLTVGGIDFRRAERYAKWLVARRAHWLFNAAGRRDKIQLVNYWEL
ncbi:MAG: hypothetical protein KGJ80_20935, partial [Chloroflexota bacterium]|nr:hypothetical protein [Chloroflexota bacterium]